MTVYSNMIIETSMISKYDILYMKLGAAFVMCFCIAVSIVDSEVLVHLSCILLHKTCHDSITLQGYTPNMFSPLYKLCM
jgi:hypothetical protein